MPPHSLGDTVDVWLVDDHDVYRETITGLLNKTPGMRCPAGFATCEEALVALEGGSLPALILMDIGLPGMSGIEGVSRVRSLAPAVPVIMLTVHQENERIFQAICAGAAGYLPKTASPQDILNAIDQALRGGAPIDAQIARRVLDMFTRLAVPHINYGLREREKEILEHLVAGRTKRQIAEHLFLSPHTISGHVRNIYAKLEVHTRTGAVAKALKEHLI